MTSPDSWRPTATAALLQARAELLRDIRRFFDDRGILEVETPVLSMAGNTDPAIESIQTNNDRFLRTSPEFALKRLLAAGSGDIYELGRVFRQGECGRNHNPEFTMLEWYRTGFGYQALMTEVADLVRFCGKDRFQHWPVTRLSYQQLFLNHLDIDPFEAGVDALKAVADDNGIETLDLNRRQWLDLLVSLVIQPALPSNALTFVYDFPVEQAALARVRDGSPPVAERFELYLGQIELANGYQELTDAIEQQQRFSDENARRIANTQYPYPIDDQLVNALLHGLPECAGVALGVDRLLMAIEDCSHLDEVIAFPYSRA